jgi:two-component system phosphate regulon response regulator PhoB
MKPKILLIEDEASIVELVKYNLSKNDFIVETVSDGEEAINIIFSNKKFDLIIVDWMLPHLSGIELCRRIRKDKKTKNIPLIMLTARGEEEDRLRGFEAEVDDYITKPFSVNELIARIKAVLKRLRPIFYEEVLTYKNIHMDISTHKVTRENKIIKLGPTEFNLLRFFLENQGRVYSREQLLDHVWQHGTYVEPRTVDVHIRRLRKAINDGYKEDPIRTIRSAGYSLGL